MSAVLAESAFVALPVSVLRAVDGCTGSSLGITIRTVFPVLVKSNVYKNTKHCTSNDEYYSWFLGSKLFLCVSARYWEERKRANPTENLLDALREMLRNPE